MLRWEVLGGVGLKQCSWCRWSLQSICFTTLLCRIISSLNMLPLLYHAFLSSTTTHSPSPFTTCIYIYILKLNHDQTIWDIWGTWWEHLGNLTGTPCELDGNTLGTWWEHNWEQKKNPKKALFPHVSRESCLNSLYLDSRFY